ncbi:restriction endonuclease subunit S [Morganella morganii]|uniref:restriction endonuclease subunit S n=1 Tax=Morganella morganii TaxID=582 RepID=UPI000BBD3D5D|nr:restriction endonuclease subunit S [Morganella morganii]ATF55345.1 restriction endonuclease [Morganella morganii]MDN3816470.1 restriction endonuclease subunit S [Morganella morganii]
MTVEKLITDHIDIWSSALQTRSAAGRGSNGKIDLYGIKKLRELILELAVRGKLVPQDPNDEPASELLKRIAAEKAELVKQGKIKKQKPLPEISEDEKPFELPVGWEWVRLGDLGLIGSSSRVHQQDWKPDGIPFYRAREIVTLAKYGEVNNDLFISPELFESLCLNGLSPETNDIMLTGVGTIGVPYIVKPYDKFYFKDASVLIFKNTHAIYSEYLNKIFTSKYWKDEIHKYSMGTTVHTLTISRANEVLIPFASEQDQIGLVSKIDELMLLCDQLEQQSLSSLDAHQQLVETLLATLTDSQNTKELSDNWVRISQHFDTLFTTEASIDALKQTILQLAVMGKLVPQDPNDEPASELLKRIEQEKAQLVKEGKIKKQKPLPPVSDEEKPFELPVGWEWCRISDIAMFTTSGSRDWAKYYSEKGALFVTMGNLSKYSYDLRMDNLRYVTPPVEGEGLRTKLEPFDLVISITGDVGNLGLIPEGLGEAYINQHTCLLRLIPICHNYYFPEFMRSPMAKLQFNTPQRGIKNSFRLSDVEEIYLPLPPLEEQHRIADKVNEYLLICSHLKSCLQSAQQTRLHLADALTDAALN